MIALLNFLTMPGCKHEPLIPAGEPTGENNGTGNNGNNSGNGLPCNPDSIYFQQQILPFLITNCAKSGCHDAASAQDGVILNNYNNVINTGEVEAFDPDNSDLWEVITESDPDKVMPPPGENQLTQSQINMIEDWINQGAQNLICDDGLAGCDSLGVSYSIDVQPIIQNKCVGCHATGNSGNAFVNLSSYSGVAAVASTNQLVGAITHNQNYAPMPMNGPMLSGCEIGKIRSWVNEGMLNN